MKISVPQSAEGVEIRAANSLNRDPAQVVLSGLQCMAGQEVWIVLKKSLQTITKLLILDIDL